MQVNTMSIVIGGLICNASCPFCVARLTSSVGMPHKADKPKWRNLETSVKFAERSGVSTFLLTGKGEPTLYPEHVTEALDLLVRSSVPFRELQTNAIPLTPSGATEDRLRAWRILGLNTIAISVVHYEDGKNHAIYTPTGKYPCLSEKIAFLRKFGFNIRLSCIMCRGYVDSPQEVANLMSFAKANDVAQVTLIPVTKPEKAEDMEAYKWVTVNNVDPMRQEIFDWLELEGTRVLVMPHGAAVYDLNGQNVCLSNCLTESQNPDTIRQLIYFTHDASLRYSWQYPGARLL